MERGKGKYSLVEDGTFNDTYDLGVEMLSDVVECAHCRSRSWASRIRLVKISVWFIQIGMLLASLTSFILSGRAIWPVGRVERMLEVSTFCKYLPIGIRFRRAAQHRESDVRFWVCQHIYLQLPHWRRLATSPRRLHLTALSIFRPFTEDIPTSRWTPRGSASRKVSSADIL